MPINSLSTDDTRSFGVWNGVVLYRAKPAAVASPLYARRFGLGTTMASAGGAVLPRAARSALADAGKEGRQTLPRTLRRVGQRWIGLSPGRAA
jgi:hypothetical protein